MKQNRDEAITTTLKWEGGYSNHPSDPGGPTNWGITIADVKKYVKSDATAQDVKNLTKQQAIDIYVNKYWKTLYYDCDTLESGVDLAVFDFGVNSGPSRAKKYLLESIGGTSVETVNKLMDAREAYLKSLRIFHTFGKGWLNRTADIRKVALSMANRMPPTAPTEPTDALFSKLWATLAAIIEAVLKRMK